MHGTIGPLADSHNHLQHEALASRLPEALRRASDAGVELMVCNGTHKGDWPHVRDIARASPAVIPSFGLHPWHVERRSRDWLDRLEQFLDSCPSAVGEIGLDRMLTEAPDDQQEQVFREQLRTAHRRGLPATVHCLRAWGWLMDILTSLPHALPRLVVHAYGGSADTISGLVDLGAYISFAGNALGAGRRRAIEAMRAVPLDRLLIETDAPDLLPPPPRQPDPFLDQDGAEVNEPANLQFVLAGIARIRSESPEQVAAETWRNAVAVFGGSR